MIDNPLDNPFERWGLDPFEGPAAITERMRELIEDADESTRAQLRHDWEELTMHPRRRVEWALTAYPETRAPVGHPPRPRPRVASSDATITLADLVTLPSVAAALEATVDTRRLPDVGLCDDPILHPTGRKRR